MDEQAALWALRIAGQDASDARVDWEALTAWLEEEPTACSALDAAQSALDLIRANRRALLDGSVKLRAKERSRALRGRWSWSVGVAGLAAAAACLTIIGRPPAPRTWQAAPSRTLKVALADGSHVVLDRSARLTELGAGGGRDVELTRGSQALFDITRDSARPFRIAVGTSRIRVLGTLFDVDDTPQGLEVTVGRGTVEVEGPTGADRIRVGAGQSYRRGPDGRVILTRASTREIGGWRAGELTYVDSPLAPLAGDLARYWRRPVQLAPGTERVRFTGVLVIDTPALMASRLQRVAPITVRETASGFVLQARDRKS